MEGWFKNISAAAAEAAERASKLAQQTAEQAKNYAGPAMEKAKVLSWSRASAGVGLFSRGSILHAGAGAASR